MSDRSAFPGAASFRRAAAVRAGLIATLWLALAAVVGVSLRQQAGIGIPFMAMVGAVGLVTMVVVLRWPVAGVALLLLGTVLLEPFPVPGDPTTVYTWIFHANISSWTPVRIAVSPLEVLFILTAIAWVIQAGDRGRIALPMGLLGGAVLAFGLCVVGGFLYGVGLNAGDSRIALWEVRAPAYLIGAYFLAGAVVRSAGRLRAVVWIVAAGLILNALRVSWRYFSLGELEQNSDQGISGTAHENALFLALLIVLALVYSTFGKRGALRWSLLLSLPMVMFALMISQRRVAFVVLLLGLIAWAMFLLAQRRSLFWKIIPPLLVLGALYTGAFWNRPTGVLGQPVRAIQSALGTGPVSERDQSSDLYRQIEEYNIWRTIRDQPLTGIGFGRPFVQYMPMVVLTNWEFQFYTPHNQVFWIWLKTGVVGFVVTLWLFALSIARLACLARATQDEHLKPFLITALTFAMMLLVFAYVDVGFANGRAMLLLGSLLGIAANVPSLAPAAVPVARARVTDPATRPWAVSPPLIAQRPR